MNYSNLNASLGQTLTELLLVLAISGFLFYSALPFGSQFLRRNELDKRVNVISNAVNFARNQSFILGSNLILSPLEGDKDWKKGMQLTSQLTHKLIRQWHWRKNLISVQWKGFKKGGQLLFSNTLEHALLSGSFLLSDNKQLKRRIIINRVGRVRIEQSS